MCPSRDTRLQAVMRNTQESTYMYMYMYIVSVYSTVEPYTIILNLHVQCSYSTCTCTCMYMYILLKSLVYNATLHVAEHYDSIAVQAITAIICNMIIRDLNAGIESSLFQHQVISLTKCNARRNFQLMSHCKPGFRQDIL